MNAYLETSVIVRKMLNQPSPLREWGVWEHAFTSDLTRVEAIRALYRLRLEGRMNDDGFAFKRGELAAVLNGADIVTVSPSVLDRAAQPFPTVVGALDAIHLATALLKEDELEGELVFLTHDRQLAIAARAVGFEVRGVPAF